MIFIYSESHFTRILQFYVRKVIIMGPILHLAQSGVRRNASVVCYFSPEQASYSHPAPRCLNNKNICALRGTPVLRHIGIL